MNKMPYPVELCNRPPLKSEVIHKCGDTCKSTVTILHDMSSDMYGRKGLVKELEQDHEILLMQNRGHYNIIEEGGYYWKDGDDGTSLNMPAYIPDPDHCKNMHGIDAYTLEMFADDTKRILDENGIEKTDIVGFSLGGMIAQVFSSKYPKKVRKLAVGKTFTKYKDWITSGKNLIPDFLLQAGYWLHGNSKPGTIDGRYHGCNVPLSVLDDMGRHLLDADLTNHQLRITAPTMVIHCSDDDIVGEPVKKIKDAKEVEMNFCGHVFNGRNKAMYKKVKKFLGTT